MKFNLLPHNVVKTVQSHSNEVWDWANQYSKAKDYHDLGYKGQGVVIYIIDTMGVTDHPDILPNLLVDKCKDFHGDGLESVNGHGIWCGSKCFSPANGFGVKGIAPLAKGIGYKAMSNSGSGFSPNLAKAIRAVADDELPEGYGAKVINMSLGSSSPMDDVRQAMEYAVAKGVVIVCAAGNNNGAISYPAAYDDLCIGVGSINQQEQKSWFSNKGDAVDTVAGGENVYGAYKNNGYAFLQGTSMSTPLVTGVIALEQSRRMLKNYPPMTQSETEFWLETQVKDLGEAGFDIIFGHGALQVNIEDLPVVDDPVDEEPVEAPSVDFCWTMDVGDYNRRKCYKLEVVTKEFQTQNNFYDILSSQYFNILSSFFLYQASNTSYVEYLNNVKDKLEEAGKNVVSVKLITDKHGISI